MNEQAAPAQTDYSDLYYSPPRLPWWVLFISLWIANLVVYKVVFDAYQSFATDVIYESWGVYLCVWIRRLDPKARSLYWLLASIAIDCVAVFIIPPKLLFPLNVLEIVFRVASAICSIAGIYILRGELLRHYNEQEKLSLALGPIATFFFSFLYFQYHIYNIAEYKRKEREALVPLPQLP